MLATNKTKSGFCWFKISNIFLLRKTENKCHTEIKSKKSASIFVPIDVFVIYNGTHIREAHYNWFRFGKNPNSIIGVFFAQMFSSFSYFFRQFIFNECKSFHFIFYNYGNKSCHT
jgi:hypothetical protein